MLRDVVVFAVLYLICVMCIRSLWFVRMQSQAVTVSMGVIHLTLGLSLRHRLSNLAQA